MSQQTYLLEIDTSSDVKHSGLVLSASDLARERAAFEKAFKSLEHRIAALRDMDPEIAVSSRKGGFLPLVVVTALPQVKKVLRKLPGVKSVSVAGPVYRIE